MKARVYLGFDYGEKTIGVAIGQTLTARARALATLRVTRGHPDWSRITRLIGEWQPDALVVGLPLNMDGSEGPVTRAARGFGKHLQDRYNLPVHMVDERLTTNAAKTSLVEAGVPARRHKQKKDMLAAQIILQTFLNECSGTSIGQNR